MTSSNKNFVKYDRREFSDSHYEFVCKTILLEGDAGKKIDSDVDIGNFTPLDSDQEKTQVKNDSKSSTRPLGPRIAFWYKKEFLDRPCILLLHGASIGHQNFFYPKTPEGRHDGKNWCSLVDYLIYHGFCPIVADWRSSMNVVEQIFGCENNYFDKNQDFDAVAYEDIPALLLAIKKVREEFFTENNLKAEGSLKIDVIGKCVGGSAISQCIATKKFADFQYDKKISINNLVIISLGLFFQVGMDGYLKSQDGVLPQLLTSETPQAVIDPDMSKSEIVAVNIIDNMIMELMSLYYGCCAIENTSRVTKHIKLKLEEQEEDFTSSVNKWKKMTSTINPNSRLTTRRLQFEAMDDFVSKFKQNVRSFSQPTADIGRTDHSRGMGNSTDAKVENTQEQMLTVLSKVQSDLAETARKYPQFALNRWPRIINELYNNAGFIAVSFREKQNDVPDKLNVTHLHDQREYYRFCNRLAFIYGNIGHDPAFDDEYHKDFMSKQFFGKMPTRILLHGARNIRRGWAARFNATRNTRGLNNMEFSNNHRECADNDMECANNDMELVNECARARYHKCDKITLITGYWNRVWHRDSIDRMYEWLTSGPNALKAKKSE